jgi:hypothetical protein
MGDGTVKEGKAEEPPQYRLYFNNWDAKKP